MVYHFTVHEADQGYWAECRELSGCSTQGDTLDEVRRNAREALDLYLDEPEDSQCLPPLPETEGPEGELSVAADPGLALALVLRHERRRSGLTQSEAARRLGARNIFSYQRLERRGNPSLKTLQKLKRVFPELSVDQILED